MVATVEGRHDKETVDVYCVRKLMRVALELFEWRRHRFEEHAVKVTEADFTFVAIDDNGRPRPIQG